MRKYIILGILLVIVIGLVVVWLNLNNIINRNKQLIISRAEDVLQREIEIEDIGITLWGGLGIVLKGIRIKDDPAFSASDFLKAASLQVNVKLLPLLHKEILVKKVILHEPVILIIRNKQGEFNFSTLMERKPVKEATYHPIPAQVTVDPPEAPALPLMISVVRIKRGELRYLDRALRTAKEIRVRGLDLELEDIGYQRPIKLRLSANLFHPKDKNIQVKATIGPVGYQPDPLTIPIKGKLELGPLDIQALLAAVPSAAEVLPPGIDLQGPLSLRAQVTGTIRSLIISQLELSIGVLGSEEPNIRLKDTEVEIKGPRVSLKDLKVKLKAELGPLPLERLKVLAPLKEAFSQLTIAEGPLFLTARTEGSLAEGMQLLASLDASSVAVGLANGMGKPKDIPAELQLDCRWKGEGLACSDIRLRLHKLKGKARGDLVWRKRPRIDLNLVTDQISLDQWDPLLPMVKDYALSGTLSLEAQVEGPLSAPDLLQIKGKARLKDLSLYLPGLGRKLKEINASLFFAGDRIEIREAALSCGSTRLKVNATVTDLTRPTLVYQLTSPELALKDFIQLKQAGGAGEYVFREVVNKGKLELAKQVATITRLDFKLFDGSFQGQARCDFRQKEEPRFELDSQIRDMALGELLPVALATPQTPMTGRLNLNMRLKGQGMNWEKIQDTLTASGDVRIEEGTLVNMNIPEMVLTKITGLPGLAVLVSSRIKQRYPDLFAGKDTVFKQMSSHFILREKRVQIKDLLIEAPSFLISGEGWIDLTKRVNFAGNLFLGEQLTQDIMEDFEAAKYLTNEKGQLAFPFRISGLIPHLKPVPDTASIRKRLRRAFIRRGTEEIWKKLLPQRGETTPRTEEKEATTSSPGQQSKPEAPTPEEMIRKTLEGIFGR